jgi:hypothetical protein
MADMIMSEIFPPFPVVQHVTISVQSEKQKQTSFLSRTVENNINCDDWKIMVAFFVRLREIHLKCLGLMSYARDLTGKVVETALISSPTRILVCYQFSGLYSRTPISEWKNRG